jgi:hypothetical protein
VING